MTTGGLSSAKTGTYFPTFINSKHEDTPKQHALADYAPISDESSAFDSGPLHEALSSETSQQNQNKMFRQHSLNLTRARLCFVKSNSARSIVSTNSSKEFTPTERDLSVDTDTLPPPTAFRRAHTLSPLGRILKSKAHISHLKHLIPFNFSDKKDSETLLNDVSDDYFHADFGRLSGLDNIRITLSDKKDLETLVNDVSDDDRPNLDRLSGFDDIGTNVLNKSDADCPDLCTENSTLNSSDHGEHVITQLQTQPSPPRATHTGRPLSPQLTGEVSPVRSHSNDSAATPSHTSMKTSSQRLENLAKSPSSSKIKLSVNNETNSETTNIKSVPSERGRLARHPKSETMDIKSSNLERNCLVPHQRSNSDMKSHHPKSPHTPKGKPTSHVRRKSHDTRKETNNEHSNKSAKNRSVSPNYLSSLDPSIELTKNSGLMWVKTYGTDLHVELDISHLYHHKDDLRDQEALLSSSASSLSFKKHSRK